MVIQTGCETGFPVMRKAVITLLAERLSRLIHCYIGLLVITPFSQMTCPRRIEIPFTLGRLVLQLERLNRPRHRLQQVTANLNSRHIHFRHIKSAV